MRTDKFVIIPATLRLDERTTVMDLGVYTTLMAYMNNDTRQCYPSVSTIAKETKISDSTVRKSLERLEELGYIHIYREKLSNGRNKPNLYTILDASKIDITSIKGEKEEESKAPTFEELQGKADKKAPKKEVAKKPVIKKVVKEEEEVKVELTIEESKLDRHSQAIIYADRLADKQLETLLVESGCKDLEELEVVEVAKYNKIISNYCNEIGLIHLNSKIEKDLGERCTKAELLRIEKLSPIDYTPIIKAIDYTKGKLSKVDNPINYLYTMVGVEVRKQQSKEVI